MLTFNFEYLVDRPEYVPQVARWWFDEWGHLSPDASVEGFAATLHGVVNRDNVPIHVIATLNESLLGVAVLKRHEMVDLYPEKCFWLGGVFVAPEFRRQNLGSALAMKIVEIAKAQGVSAIHLQTQRLDGGLYARLGWQAIEQVHYKGYDALVMVKPLA